MTTGCGRIRSGTPLVTDVSHFNVIASTTGNYMKAEVEKAQTLLSRDYKDPQIVVTPTATVHGIGREDETEGCSGTTSCYGLVTKGNGDAFLMKEQHTSLSCGGGQAGQGYPAILHIGSSAVAKAYSDKASTLRAGAGAPKHLSDIKGRLVGQLQKEAYCTGIGNKIVRRLTPLECERLQGLPDGYTLIDDKICSDSARYKALGNGMAQPCADFVISAIVGKEE